MHIVLTIGCSLLLGVVVIGALTVIFCLAHYQVDLKKTANNYTRGEIEDIIDKYAQKLEETDDREQQEYYLDCIDYYKEVLRILDERGE